MNPVEEIEKLKARFPGIRNISLTPQQAQAVCAVDKPALVLAVPGSGKTTVLVMRLGYMLYVRGISPRRILTVTYTTAAADDMKKRFISFFGAEDAAGMEFRTINSLCVKIMNSFERLTGRRPFELLTDEKVLAALLTDILKKHVGGFPGESERAELQRKIACAKNMMLSPEETEALGDKSYPFRAMFEDYCAEMKRRRLMDFDDQMVYARTMLINYPALLDEYVRAYPYICVDEAQDTSKIQHAIIDLLARENGRLFMVGDEDQSIYGFRAAYPEALLTFADRYRDADILYLEKNFRSDGYIVETAERFIGRNRFRYQKKMISERRRKNGVSAVAFTNRVLQYDHIAALARDCETDTAVLYRDNESAVPIVDRLEREGLDYNLRAGDLTFFSCRVVRDVREIIAFALDRKNTELFLRLYFKLGTYLKKSDAQAACELSVRLGIPVTDAVFRLKNIARGTLEQCSAVRSALNMLEKASGKEAISLISYGTGYREHLTKMGMRADKLQTLSAIAAPLEKAVMLPSRLDELEQTMRDHVNSRACPFTLSTVHSSKGLEYGSVYLCDVFDGVFPESVPDVFASGRKKLSPEEERALRDFEEERRLFYVAMTRAKNELTVFVYKNAPSVFAAEVCAPSRVQTSPGNVPSVKRTKNAGARDIEAFIASHPAGSVFTHRTLGALTVTGCADGFVSVTTQSGERKTFSVAVLLKNGLVKG